MFMQRHQGACHILVVAQYLAEFSGCSLKITVTLGGQCA